MKPLKEEILSADDIKLLFSNIELILTVNQEISMNFQNELDKVIDVQLLNIGSIFLKTVYFHSQFFLNKKGGIS
jgi:hypothetical protein